MAKIRVIKKNDDYSMDYQVGDILEVTGTWYGVPAMCGALMMLTGKWTKPGVYTVEEFDPDLFLDALDKYGLPRSENHDPALVD